MTRRKFMLALSAIAATVALPIQRVFANQNHLLRYTPKKTEGYELIYELESNVQGFHFVKFRWREIGTEAWHECPEGGMPLQKMLHEKAGLRANDRTPEAALAKTMINATLSTSVQ